MAAVSERASAKPNVEKGDAPDALADASNTGEQVAQNISDTNVPAVASAGEAPAVDKVIDCIDNLKKSL